MLRSNGCIREMVNELAENDLIFIQQILSCDISREFDCNGFLTSLAWQSRADDVEIHKMPKMKTLALFESVFIGLIRRKIMFNIDNKTIVTIIKLCNKNFNWISKVFLFHTLSIPCSHLFGVEIIYT